jgi:hypothetical protein
MTDRRNGPCPKAERNLFFSQAQPHAEHGPAGIHEDGGASEIGTEQIIACELFFGPAIEHVEHVHKKLDTRGFARHDRFRRAQVEQRLRRQSARAARFQEDAAVALGTQRD